MKNASNKLNKIQEESRIKIKKKLNYVFAKNVGLQNINTVRNILLNKHENTNGFLINTL